MKLHSIRFAGAFAMCGWALLPLAVARGADSPQEAAVRQALVALAEAVNRHDAVAVAACWSEDAVYLDASQDLQLNGRAEIEAHYAGLFTAQPNAKLVAIITDIVCDGESSARVRGNVEVEREGGEKSASSFLAELAKENDRWLVIAVEETDPDPLADLAWLVGDWADEVSATNTRSKFAWDPSGRMLLRTYTLDGANGPQQGTQYIAWDARRNELRTWVFSSSGAWGEGTWRGQEDHWAVHWTGTLADGRSASATQILRPVDENTFQVQWTDIDVDGEMRPSTDPITVRRVETPGSTTPAAGQEGEQHE